MPDISLFTANNKQSIHVSDLIIFISHFQRVGNCFREEKRERRLRVFRVFA